jgi:putative methanogenesis marker protein 8
MAKHDVEMAKGRVRIEDGKVRVLTEPQVKHCPLRAHLYGCEAEDKSTVKRVLEGHIHELGMYTGGRVLEMEEDPVSFGASEMVSDALRDGLLDAVVVVCEGAGTVVVTGHKVVQAIGAHMTGIVRTEPIPETRSHLEALGCIILDEGCSIDQVRGYELAVDRGFRAVAVTVSGAHPDEARRIRLSGEGRGVSPLILAVHTTGISRRGAQILAKHCDIVWGCASRQVREVVGPRAKLQIGTGIPVFALTRAGKRLVLHRALGMDQQLLVKRSELPALVQDRQPRPLL